MSNGPSTVELLVRLVFSLGLIVGLLWLAAKFARKNGGALKLPGFGKKDTSIKVLERHSLTKTASIAVVQIGSQTMIVGVTEHGITRLADGPELDDASDAEADERADDDEALLELAGADLATVLSLRTGTDSAVPAPRATATAATTASTGSTTASRTSRSALSLLNAVKPGPSTTSATSTEMFPANPSATTADTTSTPEAKRTLPLGTATANLAPPARPPRMSFVEALRELTIRKA